MQGPCARALGRTFFQTPWCPRSNCVVCQFSACHFAYCIVERHEEKARELTRVQTLGGSDSTQSWCPDFYSDTDKIKLLSLPENWVWTPSLNGA